MILNCQAGSPRTLSTGNDVMAIRASSFRKSWVRSGECIHGHAVRDVVTDVRHEDVNALGLVLIDMI